MSSVRADILEIFQQKRLAHGNLVFCRKAVKLMSLLKEIQQASDQNMTSSASPPTFAFPPRPYQPPWAHMALQKDWEKAKAVLGFWEADFGF